VRFAAWTMVNKREMSLTMPVKRRVLRWCSCIFPVLKLTAVPARVVLEAAGVSALQTGLIQRRAHLGDIRR
jgi:hypothetical protein